MEKEFLKNQKQLNKEGYVIVSSYFLDYCVEILGTGPGMLYLQLLNYCHKGKDLAWPTLATLGKKMQFTPKSITKFHQILLKHGFIKKVSKGKTASGHYKRNIYQVTPLHRVKNTLSSGNIFSQVEEKITPNPGKKLPINNSNLNITNTTTANEGKAVAADFKKSKEKGEEKMRAIRERMVELDFKEALIEKILKEYSVKKIEENLDLLLERKNIQHPAGWLMAALKHDYRDGRPEDIPIQDASISEGRGSIHRARNQETGRINPSPTKTKTNSGDNNKILSTEEVKRRFKLLRHQLITNNYLRKEEI